MDKLEILRGKLIAFMKEGDRRPASLLQKVQEELGFIPEEALGLISSLTGLPVSQVASIVNFYAHFRFKPAGSHLITICEGTACHLKGARKLKDELEKIFGTTTGETTVNGQVTLQEVRCIGCCNRAPVIVIDDETRGRVSLIDLKGLPERFQK